MPPCCHIANSRRSVLRSDAALSHFLDNQYHHAVYCIYNDSNTDFRAMSSDITQFRGREKRNADSRTTTFHSADSAAGGQGARLRTEQDLTGVRRYHSARHLQGLAQL